MQPSYYPCLWQAAPLFLVGQKLLPWQQLLPHPARVRPPLPHQVLPPPFRILTSLPRLTCAFLPNAGRNGRWFLLSAPVLLRSTSAALPSATIPAPSRRSATVRAFLPRFWASTTPTATHLRRNTSILQETVDHFAGSFNREGESVRGGFNTASVLLPFWANAEVCQPGESPMACENRIHHPEHCIRQP